MVRVPRCPDVPELPADVPLKDPNRVLLGIDAAEYVALPPFTLPEAPEYDQECDACDGRGSKHDCPDCSCNCPDCSGTGWLDPERKISTEVEGAFFNLIYVRKMLGLPGLQIAPSKDGKPMYFRFDGGCGALMPRRVRCAEHVEIFGAMTSGERNG